MAYLLATRSRRKGLDDVIIVWYLVVKGVWFRMHR